MKPKGTTAFFSIVSHILYHHPLRQIARAALELQVRQPAAIRIQAAGRSLLAAVVARRLRKERWVLRRSNAAACVCRFARAFLGRSKFAAARRSAPVIQSMARRMIAVNHAGRLYEELYASRFLGRCAKGFIARRAFAAATAAGATAAAAIAAIVDAAAIADAAYKISNDACIAIRWLMF